MAGRVSSKMKAKRLGKSINDKASDKSEEEIDTSILNTPFETSVNNLAKIVKLYQTATEEIRGFLSHECDILYECRVCRSIFRSISNFILHKRLFCQEKYGHEHMNKWPRKDDECLDIILKEQTVVTEKTEDLNTSKKKLNSIIDSLTQKKQFGFEIQNFSIDEFYKQNQASFNGPITRSNKKLELGQIEGTSSAVFQTLKSEDKDNLNDIKLEAMEIQQMTEGQTAILGPDGKVVKINQKPVPTAEPSASVDLSEFSCKKCNINFATRKTFLSHLKYKHESSRLVYPCLECSDTFATVWSVYRHLYNIHRKTLPEVRKMRGKIQAKAYRKKDEPEDKNSEEALRESGNTQQKIDELNQEWMNSFETDNDIQMCGGCGRRFERKAALNSHSQTCQKRIAAKNIINANKQKRIAAAEEKIEKKNSKTVKTESENERKFFDTHNVAKKRKIGIQIRCDYTKPVEKNINPTSASKTYEYTSQKNPLQINVQSPPAPKSVVKSNDKQSPPSKFFISHINNDTQSKIEGDLQEAEIVSIPSSNSSPCKDNQDPLLIKDSQSSSDSEIEEIIGPLTNSMCEEDIPCTENFENIQNFEDEDKIKISNINESTLKLIKLINSDITIENVRPSLDDKMTNYVNFKKLLCIPCDTKFGNISKLRSHMATHFNWWRYRCDICSLCSYDKTDVVEHIKNVHSIQKYEKVEAVILQLPDWETCELSSKEFIPRENVDNIPIVNNSPLLEEEKKQISIICTPEIDNCIIIDTESEEKSSNSSNKTKSSKKNKGLKVVKVKTKTKKTEIPDTKTNELLGEVQFDSEQLDNDPLGSRSSSRCAESSNSQELKKMVYEVIFGDVSMNNPAVTNSSGEEKDNLQIVSSNDVSNVISRPVRNRVKHIDKDFIYDLSEFKEQQKTVLVTNSCNSSTVKSDSNQISELLEDNLVVVSGNGNKINKNYNYTNKPNKSSSKNYMGNVVNKLNLQKRSITKFHSTSSHGRSAVGAEVFSNDNVTVHPTDNVSDGDDDIYIVENEELVAVK